MYKHRILILLCMLLLVTTVVNAAEQKPSVFPDDQQMGKQFVLLIGINEYRYLPYLKAPINNINLMAEALNEMQNHDY